MDATSFIAVLGLTVFFVVLCAVGVYVNCHRNTKD